MRWLIPCLPPQPNPATPSAAASTPQLEAEFGEQWAAGGVAGWEDRGAGGAGGGAADAPGALDLDAFDSADELEMLGECARAHGRWLARRNRAGVGWAVGRARLRACGRASWA